ncbi:MAG: M15 family metallopeptidase, partial [Gaiellales bacterium]
MGIEQASARVRELQTLTQTIRGTSSPAIDSAAAGAQGTAFTAQLQAQMLMSGEQPDAGFAGAAGVPVINAQQLLQMQGAGGSAGGLGIQAMLQGVTPGAATTGPSNHVTGKVDGLAPALRAGLEKMGAQLGVKIDVISGQRSYEEQAELYRRYLNGTGNLAAPPGRSNHESGNAADAYVNGVALASVPGAREAAAAAGLGFPVAGEAWHVE